MRSRLTYLWKEPKIGKNYRSAVSLHGHTNHSKEGLYFIGDYADRNPLLRAALNVKRKEAKSNRGITLDFRKAHWTPPLPPLAAYRLERDQIERVLRLKALVSLSDHDNIEAPMVLRVLPETRNIPISTEWSLPYQDTVLHIGVHNIPCDRAEGITAQLANYTAKPRPDQLGGVFEMLCEMPDVLIVFNHPMWDLAGVGKQRHFAIVHDFVAELGMFLHAFELGGFRSWEENQAVVEFAERWDQVVIGGGDRHGTEPSAVVNLTNAEEFADFVKEVRQRRRCHVLFMPQYSEPFILRMLQSLLDIIRDYPDHPRGSRRWEERVFHPDRYGILQPVGTLWGKTPAYIEAFFWVVRWLETPPVRRAAQALLAKPEHQMQFVPGRGREVVSQWTKAYASRSFQTRGTKLTAWRTPAGTLTRSPKGADSAS